MENEDKKNLPIEAEEVAKEKAPPAAQADEEWEQVDPADMPETPADATADKGPVETPRGDGAAKLVTDQGLTGDKYYVSEPWVDSKRLDGEEEEELSGIEIRYDLRPEEARTAMKAFQKKTLFKKNIIYTVVLAILAVLYLQAVIRNPDYSMGKVLGVFSVLVIGLLWYLPARHISQTVKGIAQSNDTFTIEVSEVGFLIREEGGKYLIRYNTATVSVLELPEVFVVLVSKEKMFAIPKRCVPQERMEEIKSLMKQGLGDKYQVQA